MWGAATPAPVRCRRERSWLRGSHMATGQRAPARCPRCHVCSHPIRCYRCGECSPSARSASALARSLSRWTKARAARVTASTSDRVASRVASVRRGAEGCVRNVRHPSRGRSIGLLRHTPAARKMGRREWPARDYCYPCDRSRPRACRACGFARRSRPFMVNVRFLAFGGRSPPPRGAVGGELSAHLYSAT